MIFMVRDSHLSKNNHIDLILFYRLTTIFKLQKLHTYSMRKILLALFCLFLDIITITTAPGSMQGIASGIIETSNTKIPGPPLTYETYDITFGSQLGSNPAAYAFALAGFQTAKQQSAETVRIVNVVFSANKAGMAVGLKYQYTLLITTHWKMIKWTYLVVSSTFDGTYTNIWATFAEFNITNQQYVDVPIDPVGTAFLNNGGAPKDCNIYVDPLLQVDLQGCESVPANGIYKGGKPIIHAYISGFQSNFRNHTLPTINVQKGTNLALKSDSGWQIKYSSPPNGPKITLTFQPLTLLTLQLSFVFTRMDFYAPHYPLNSQLQYSSSHLYFLVSTYNTAVPLATGQLSEYNQNWVLLPDGVYAIYGLTGFTINTAMPGDYEIRVAVGKSDYFVTVPNSNINNVYISGDFFIKNVQKICEAKTKQIALKGRSTSIHIVPSGANEAVDATSFISLPPLTPSPHPLVYKYGVPSTTQTSPVSFKNTMHFQPGPALSSTLLVQIRVFSNPAVPSLIEGQQYTVKVEANGAVILDLAFVQGPVSGQYKSPLYKIALSVSGGSTVKVVTTVGFTSKGTSQELYVLVAANLQGAVYDPLTKSCLPQCPSTSAVNANVYPLTCYPCETDRVYSPLEGKCICKEGTYLDSATKTCKNCGPNCATCSPTNPSFCNSCIGSIVLVNNTCGCPNGQYSTLQGCSPCPSQCLTCASPSGLCLTCNKTHSCFELTCQCASGWFDSRTKDCGTCHPLCETCSRNNPCLTCREGLKREMVQGTCTCQLGYYQAGKNRCGECDPTCASCSVSSFNCTACHVGYNRVLNGSECRCKQGYVSAGAICVISQCPTDPLCLQCVTTTNNLSICTRCDPNLNRVLDPTINSCVCKQGYYNWFGVCKPCGSGCLKCLNEEQCSICAPLSVNQGDGTCSCPPRSYLSSTNQGTFCQQCPQLCLKCSNSTSCSLCADKAVPVNGLCKCIDTYFINKTTGQCQQCGQGCLTCTHEGCRSCQPPLVLNQGQCLSSCPLGYSLTNRICISCVDNCQQCLDYSTCKSCRKGYHLYQQKCWQKCPARTVPYEDDCGVEVCRGCQVPCEDCQDSPDFCTSCPQHYHLYKNQSSGKQTCLRRCPQGTALQNNRCQPCQQDCLVCNPSPSLCTRCRPPLTLYKRSCVQQCPSHTISTTTGLECYDTCPFGTYATNKTCSPCSYLCASCDRLSTNCTSCKTGILVDYGVCANVCLQNQYVLGGVCHNCSHPCAKCFRDKDYCIACAEGMVAKDGQCVMECPLGQFFDQSKIACLPCSEGCAKCEDQDRCLTCKVQQYKPINGLCPFSPKPCLSYSHDSRCLQCPSSTLLFNGACVSSCPSWTSPSNGQCLCPSPQILMHDQCAAACEGGYYSIDNMCLLCSPSCRLCQGSSTNCTACFSQDNLVNNTCVRNQPCNYGQQLTNGLCSPQCVAGLYFFQGFCVTRCLDGFGVNQLGACARNWQYMCPEGSYYLQGQCLSACPSGYRAKQQTNQCEACPLNCAECLSSSECYHCKNTHILVQGQCYLYNCSPGQVLLNDQCVSSCPLGTLPVSKVCIPRCQPSTYFFDSLCYYQCPSGLNSPYACLANSSTPSP